MSRVWIAIVFALACGDRAAVDEVAATAPIIPAKDAIAKTTENGPVKAKVLVWPAKPKLGEPIYVRLEVEAPVGVSIDAPFQEAGDQRLGRFHVVGFTRDTQRAPSGGQLHEQTYTLEAPTSGRHRVPPLRFEMVDARNAGSDARRAKPQEVLTDEIPLEIAPVPTETASAELQPALGGLEATVGGTSWVVVLGLASLIAVLGSGSVLLLRAARRRQRIADQRSAYDEAISNLEELGKRGAPDATAADDWFVDLSSIVRRYLERRYEIRAPELTTEEFLLVATARPSPAGGSIATGARLPSSGIGLDDEHRTMLSDFLERCDRVKFAGYRPEADESLATLAAARRFVDDTRLRVASRGEAA